MKVCISHTESFSERRVKNSVFLFIHILCKIKNSTELLPQIRMFWIFYRAAESSFASLSLFPREQAPGITSDAL